MFDTRAQLLVTAAFGLVYAVMAVFVVRFFYRRHRANEPALDVEVLRGLLRSRTVEERRERRLVRSGPNAGAHRMATVRYHLHEVVLQEGPDPGAVVRLESRTPWGTVGRTVPIERRLSDGRYQPRGTASRIRVSSPVMFVLKSAFVLAILFVFLRGLWLPVSRAVSP